MSLWAAIWLIKQGQMDNMDLLPYMCASDHFMPELVHAKLIRTHICALGSDSCDYWYVEG